MRANYKLFCDICERNVFMCGKCFNNTCNGGYGVLEDGTKCDQCESAHSDDRALVEHEASLPDDAKP